MRSGGTDGRRQWLALARSTRVSRFASFAVSPPAGQSEYGPAKPSLKKVGAAVASGGELAPDGVSALPGDVGVWTPVKIIVNNPGDLDARRVDKALGKMGNRAKVGFETGRYGDGRGTIVQVYHEIPLEHTVCRR